jgi:hypothetical protein
MRKSFVYANKGFKLTFANRRHQHFFFFAFFSSQNSQEMEKAEL